MNLLRPPMQRSLLLVLVFAFSTACSRRASVSAGSVGLWEPIDTSFAGCAGG